MLLAVRLRARLRPRESLVLGHPSPPPPQPGPMWGEGGGVTEGGSGLREAAGCRGARRAREPRGHNARLTATLQVRLSP